MTDLAKMEPVIVPDSLWQAMVDHARREAPLEACGILGGKDGRAASFHPCRNVEASPIRYRIDPAEILRIMRLFDASGQDLLAIFHSHPATEAYPSATDVRLAFYPDAYYLILSLATEPPILRAFRIREGQVAEYPVERSG